MPQKKFRILALDGGGIRGVMSAKILERVQEKIGQPLNEYFDLIAGTSTGSILAACLVLGKTPTELIQLYQDEGKTIFSTNFWRKNLGYWLKQPKYSNDGLKQVLQKHFDEIPLASIQEEAKKRNPNSNPKARLLILAYSTTQRYTNFFLSPFVDENPWYKNAKLWEVCLSSAAAPTFFPPYQFNVESSPSSSSELEAEYTFVDGGISANNPALAALVHTLDIEKLEGERIKLEDISLLSIGTGRTTAPFNFNDVNSWGALSWASRIPDVFMGGQFQITADLCGQLIKPGNPNGYLRLQLEMNQQYKISEQNPEKLVRLPKEKQVNFYTGRHLDEAMDRADLDHVNDLIDTTQNFLDSQDCYRKIDDVKYSVDQAIAHFIEANQ